MITAPSVPYEGAGGEDFSGRIRSKISPKKKTNSRGGGIRSATLEKKHLKAGMRGNARAGKPEI